LRGSPAMGSSRRPPPVAQSVGERKKNGIDDLEGTNHCSYLNPVFVPSGNRNISIQWRLIPHRPPVTATVPSNSLSQRRAAWLAVEAATLAHCLMRVLQQQRWQLLQQYTGNFSGVLPQPGGAPAPAGRLPGPRPGVQALRQGPGAGDPTARARHRCSRCAPRGGPAGRWCSGMRCATGRQLGTEWHSSTRLVDLAGFRDNACNPSQHARTQCRASERPERAE